MLRKASFLGLVALVALCGPALAGTTQNITITVTVEFLSVAVNPTTVAFGTVAASSTTIGTKLDITNDGNVAENIGLRITTQDDRGEWTAAAAPGPNQYVLYSIVVTDGGGAPTTGNCGADDDLTDSVQYWGGDGTAANSLLTSNVASATAVAAGGLRDLYFGFAAPASVSGPNAGAVHTITAELSVYKD